MLRESELLDFVREASEAELRACIAAGWIVPGEREGARVYEDIDAARLRLIHELRGDLALGDEALPVVLSLLDQLHTLRFNMRCLAEALSAAPEEARQRIADALASILIRATPPAAL